MKLSNLLVSVCLGFAASHCLAVEYCAIEVGSKGVKARLYSLSVSDAGLDQSVKFKQDVNTTISASMRDGNFSAAAIAETAEAAAGLMKQMRTLNPACTGFVVGSSGVAKAQNRDDLAHAIEDKADVRNVEFISVEKEAEYAFIASVRPKDRASALLIDVGSGNTKIGYFNATEGRFLAMEIPYGSVSLTKRVQDQRLDNFRQGYSKVIATEIRPKFQSEVQSRPGVVNRTLMYWVGGAAWATATYTHPEKAKDAVVSLTESDVEDFLTALERKTWTERVAPGTLKADVRKAFEDDFNVVKDIFLGENLQCGVGIAKMILVEGSSSRKLRFPRNGQWLNGYTLARFKAE